MDIHNGYVAFEVRAGSVYIENVSGVLLPVLGPTPRLILDLEFNGIRDALSALGSFGEKRRLEIRERYAATVRTTMPPIRMVGSCGKSICRTATA